MLDLSSEDGWQWSKFRIGKHARQDPNGVRGHGMARLPGGVARESSTADPGEALEEAASSASPPRPSAHVGDNIGGRRRPGGGGERERERAGGADWITDLGAPPSAWRWWRGPQQCPRERPGPPRCGLAGAAF